MKNESVLYGKTDTTPEQAGFYAPNIDKLDNFFLRLISDGKLQCAGYLLARYGNVFACRSMGKLLPGYPVKPYKPDSIRKIASVTKVFITVAVFQLMEKGKLTLDQPVSGIIKEFDTDMHRKINIFHLLTHTSGLAPDPGFNLEPYPVKRKKCKNMEEFIKFALMGPVPNQPGECWAYCSAGFIILGEIIKRVSGTDYEEYIQKNILDPLGMSDTHFSVPDEKMDRICFTSEEEVNIHKTGNQSNISKGLYSTPWDMFRFGQMMLNKGKLDNVRIVSRKSVEKMTTNHLRNVPADAWEVHLDDKKYGLGWSIAYRSILSQGVYGHEGAGRVNLLIDPLEEFVAVYFIPTGIAWVPESLLCPMAIIWAGLE